METTDVIVSLKQKPQLKQQLQAASAGVKLDLSQRKNKLKQYSLANKMSAKKTAKLLGLKDKQVYGSSFVGFAASVTSEQLADLKAHPAVESVSIDYPMSATMGKPGDGDPPPSGQSVPWGVERIGAAGAANQGAGIHVFVVDSGIDLDHPDLGSNVVDGYAVTACSSKGQMNCSTDWDDDFGHGTHVSGTIAAIDNDIGVVGVAPQVSLHAVKVLNDRGNTSASQVAAAMDYVTEQTIALGEVTVANVSIGGDGSKEGYCDATGYHGSDNYARAFCEAANAGVVIAVSGGNSGIDARNFLPSTYDDSVIAVSAAWGGPDSSEGDWWWNSSNWGAETASWNPQASAPIALGAPGFQVNSTTTVENGSYEEQTGTSMAAPHVAGAIAMYLKNHSQNNNYSAFVNIRQMLLDDSTSTAGFHNTSGNLHEENYLDVNQER